MPDNTGSSTSRNDCRKTPWNKVDFILLFFLVASIVTLIVTVTCVWYPYLVTSSFIWSQCQVSTIIPKGTQECVNPPENCVPDSFISPTPTIPANWTDDSFSHSTSMTSYNISSSSGTTSSSLNPATATASASSLTATSDTSPTAASPTLTAASTTPRYTSDTPSMESSQTTSDDIHTSVILRQRRQVTGTSPPALFGNENYCPAFPCYQVMVRYTNAIVAIGLNMPLYVNYNELQTYPSCSYSSCESNNGNNAQEVDNWINTMSYYQSSHQIFTCYASIKNYSQVIQQVSFTYGAAVNSIFWPIVGLIGFFFALVFHRCRHLMMTRSSQNHHHQPPPEYDVTSQVNYNMRPPTVMSEPPVYMTPQNVYYGAEGGGQPLPEKNAEAMGGEISFYGRTDMEIPAPWRRGTEPPPYLELQPVSDYGFSPIEVSAVGVSMDNHYGTPGNEPRY